MRCCIVASILSVVNEQVQSQWWRMNDGGLHAAEQKMRAAGQSEEAIACFRSAYERLVCGGSAMLPSAELEPVGDVPALEELPEVDVAGALSRVALIKLNGGLATTMGLHQPKSLIEARDGRSFLDIIVGQTLALRRRLGVDLPLVLMDSVATRAETLKALSGHPELAQEGLGPDFLQSMIPKLRADNLTPVSWPQAPALEWCPPGHGDVYGALRRSGMLDALLARGFAYAMISNADNLGAKLDARIAAHVASEGIQFLMEVVEGTEADRKGGHIARRRSDGQLILRESAQTPDEDEDSFRDFRRWRYYNTNNLWVDLRVLAEALDRAEGVLELPLIVNHKTVDPRDSDSPEVLQLESAMGAAIESFAGASLLGVPRTRFVPVKTTDDLLVLRSDLYTVSEGLDIEPVPELQGSLPFVELDKRFYRLLDEFEMRFPDGAPSLREAQRLVVRGDVTFGPGVVVRGAVELTADEPRRIDPGTVLQSGP
jgi:UTP--glucose-1-phosphate uridylyltransferase